MSNSHTPGPWSVSVSGEFADTAYVRAAHWGTVATVGLSHNLPHWDVPQRANAILISAAPDLLEALEDLFGADMEHVLMGDGKEDQIMAIAKARQAITKATGSAA